MKKKVIFVVNSLRPGGAEKVILLILKYLDRERFDPVLVLLQAQGSRIDEFMGDIKIYDFKKRKPFFSFPGLVLRMCGVIKNENPDILVSFMGSGNTVTALAKKITGSSAKFIANVRNLILVKIRLQGLFFLRYGIHRFVYNYADLVITNSRSAKDEMVNAFNVSEDRIKVVKNPLEIDRIDTLSAEPPVHPWYGEGVPIVIAAGKLKKAKGFEYLIEAFSKVVKKTECRLIILGEGGLREKLSAMIERFKLQGSIDLPGFKENVYSYIKGSEIFVLSSLWEGLPNVLLEAMACGKPVISTEYSESVHELIRDGENGFIVPKEDPQALADAICRLLSDRALSERFSRENKKKSGEYRAETVVDEYAEMINGTAG
ncbi:MAG: glycosyltransferase [Elusimicrobia bacterium]|nr:glycosyltransferase [Elusimicrobiota bacterium]